MSHSFKKTPIIGNCSGSEKQDKKFSHRKFRAAERECLSNDLDFPVKQQEVCNNWDFAKDGKQYLRKLDDLTKKYLRK